MHRYLVHRAQLRRREKKIPTTHVNICKNTRESCYVMAHVFISACIQFLSSNNLLHFKKNVYCLSTGKCRDTRHSYVPDYTPWFFFTHSKVYRPLPIYRWLCIRKCAWGNENFFSFHISVQHNSLITCVKDLLKTNR